MIPGVPGTVYGATAFDGADQSEQVYALQACTWNVY